MSELKASAVTASKIKLIMSSGLLDSAPTGATHYDMFRCQFLMVSSENLRFREGNKWKVSNHKDGVDMINNGECINLFTQKIEAMR